MQHRPVRASPSSASRAPWSAPGAAAATASRLRSLLLRFRCAFQDWITADDEPKWASGSRRSVAIRCRRGMLGYHFRERRPEGARKVLTLLGRLEAHLGVQ